MEVDSIGENGAMRTFIAVLSSLTIAASAAITWAGDAAEAQAAGGGSIRFDFQNTNQAEAAASPTETVSMSLLNMI